MSLLAVSPSVDVTRRFPATWAARCKAFGHRLSLTDGVESTRKKETSVQEDILKAIDENLPSVVGSLLKTRLEQGDEDRQKILELEKKLQVVQKLFDDASSENKQLLDRVDSKARLDERESQVEKKEFELKLREEYLIKSLENVEARVEDHKEMVGLIFRNTVVRTRMQNTDVVDGGPIFTGQYDSSGQQIMQDTGQQVVVTEIEQQEVQE